MRQIDEAKFFRKRAAEEHQLALEASDPAAARLHRQLAECYERMLREPQRPLARQRYDQAMDDAVAHEVKEQYGRQPKIGASRPAAGGASVPPQPSSSE